MALRSASCRLLDVLALECLMSNLLTIVTLHRSWAIFKGASHAGFSPGVEEPVGQEPPCISASGYVNNHRPVGLCAFLSAEPRNLSNGDFVLLAEGRCGSSSDLIFFVQNYSLVDAIDFDRVQLVMYHPGFFTDLRFCHFLDQLVYSRGWGTRLFPTIPIDQAEDQGGKTEQSR
ncbi:hypothetical protein N7471_013393 [Penicillium samsonianum]|uniref:uncharacterized protein n=1 Tax=Penicillium samsonianum TaxID=1882272 RepID=UPI00254672F2|nr:uncharacterized protein N7471_013393 [Penicillium samsonianum]KAJ6118773.1 hypothetical protein N7471_013393 [Penicillium samsonianum]